MPQDSDEYQWRETYFVFFPADRRPAAQAVQDAVQRLNRRLQCSSLLADEEGKFDSLTVHAPDDFAAMEISFESGEQVIEQGCGLAQELKGSVGRDPEQLAELKRLTQCDARLDVMHFERVAGGMSEEELDEVFDPSSLIALLEALVKLTGGISIDPQSGCLL